MLTRRKLYSLAELVWLAMVFCTVLLQSGCYRFKKAESDERSGAIQRAELPPASDSNVPIPIPTPTITVEEVPTIPDQLSLLPGPSQGSAVALSPDESTMIVVNRDVGSVSIMKLTYQDGQAPSIQKVAELSLGSTSEPWQAVVHPDNDSAYVVLRQLQKVVKIEGLKSTPRLSPKQAAVGSEPTGIALTPTGRLALVTNWVDGTLSVIDTATMTVKGAAIDLNSAIAPLLGQEKGRSAMAHPRSIAITNNGDETDEDESAFVTEYFSFRKQEESANGQNADVVQAGLVYKVSLSDRSVSRIELGPIADMGFTVKEGAGVVAAGCFPNQVQSISIKGKFAYVTSVCASPKGPVGPVFPQSNGANITCPNGVADCATLGLAESACVVPQAGAAAACVDLAGVKTVTAPLLSVIDIAANKEVAAARVNLNSKFRDFYAVKSIPDDKSRRYPLLANELSFVPGKNVAYVTANGVDAVFRLVVDPLTGSLIEVGTQASQPFIDLAPSGIAISSEGRGPVGIAATSKGFAIAANDVSRNVSLLDLKTQTIAGGTTSPVVVSTGALPAAGSAAEKVLRGKKFFNTGLARWSLKGQGWGSCQSCHQDALTDNVTWYFAKGPRQTVSLDGSFSKKSPDTDQRILNWTAVVDEISDFEGNTRGVSGGVGAIVKAKTLETQQRINQAAMPLAAGGSINHLGLNGSSLAASDPNNLQIADGERGVLADWAEITAYIKSIRAPRRPSNLDIAKVAAGKGVFLQANCQGCHSGDKWTVSKLFYNPETIGVTAALKTLTWETVASNAGFPVTLFPADPTFRTMRYGGTNAANFDQIVCALRPVGTFGVAEATGVVAGGVFPELRANMVTPGQGNEIEGRGFNPPSLLGMMTGAPYLHNGGARTMEALLTSVFSGHHQSLSPTFNPSNAERENLIQFLLSLDNTSEIIAVPALGPQGGDFCRAP